MHTVLEPSIDSRRSTLGTVVVTAGASAVGRSIAAAVAAAGGTPVTLDSSDVARDSLRDHRIVDPGDRVALETAIADIGKRYGKIDALVANASSDAYGAFERVPADRWERVIAVNLLGPAALVRAALPYLERAQHPHIITVASTHGLDTRGGATAFDASIYGMVGFTHALAQELAGRIGVTLLGPGDPREVAETVVLALRATNLPQATATSPFAG